MTQYKCLIQRYLLGKTLILEHARFRIMIRGLEIHGAPLRVYVDNGKVYHAHALKQTCYRIGIGLLHRAKGDPARGQ